MSNLAKLIIQGKYNLADNLSVKYEDLIAAFEVITSDIILNGDYAFGLHNYKFGIYDNLDAIYIKQHNYGFLFSCENASLAEKKRFLVQNMYHVFSHNRLLFDFTTECIKNNNYITTLRSAINNPLLFYGIISHYTSTVDRNIFIKIDKTNVELFYNYRTSILALKVNGKQTHIQQAQKYNISSKFCEHFRLALIDKFSKYLN